MLFDPLVRAKPVGYSVTSTTRIPLAPSAGGTEDSEPSYPPALQPPPSKLDHLTLIKRVQGWHRLTSSQVCVNKRRAFLITRRKAGPPGSGVGGWGTAESTPRESFTAGADHGLGGGGPGSAPERIPHLRWYFAGIFPRSDDFPRPAALCPSRPGRGVGRGRLSVGIPAQVTGGEWRGRPQPGPPARPRPAGP